MQQRTIEMYEIEFRNLLLNRLLDKTLNAALVTVIFWGLLAVSVANGYIFETCLMFLATLAAWLGVVNVWEKYRSGDL